MQFTVSTGTSKFPFKQQATKQGTHRNVPGARRGLGEVRNRSVTLLHPADANDVGIEIHVLPKQAELLTGSGAGQKWERDIEASAVVLAGMLNELGHLLGGSVGPSWSWASRGPGWSASRGDEY